MNTMIVREKPMLSLVQISSTGEESEEDVYASDLKDSSLGDIFGVDYLDGSDARRAERLKIVYKDEEGVAALLTVKEELEENGNPCYRLSEKLVWFSFN